jgi:hypothetical protein
MILVPHNRIPEVNGEISDPIHFGVGRTPLATARTAATEIARRYFAADAGVISIAEGHREGGLSMVECSRSC